MVDITMVSNPTAANASSPRHENLKHLFEENLSLINRTVDSLCYRREMQPDKTEEVRSYVYERIVGDGYRVFQGFEGTSIPNSYLILSVQNICKDYYRIQRGRWRPSTKAKELGDLGVKIDDLLNRRRVTVDQACEIIITDLKNAGTNPPPKAELLSMIDLLKIKEKGCTINPGSDVLGILAHSKTTAEDALYVKELNKKKEKLDQVIMNQGQLLSEEDQLIFKMYFEDNHTISNVARILKKKRHRVDQRLKKLFKMFKKKILSQGFSHEEIKEILNHFSKLE